MSKRPAAYTSIHRVKFSELDPYKHMRTAVYAGYFVDHRLDALREQAGWDLEKLEGLPFMTFVRRMEIEFIRPVQGDQQVSITSFVREFVGPDAYIDCTMTGERGAIASKCRMVVAYVDKATRRAADWPGDVMALFFEA